MTLHIISGNDSSNALNGGAGDDLIYGFDPNAAYASDADPFDPGPPPDAHPDADRHYRPGCIRWRDRRPAAWRRRVVTVAFARPIERSHGLRRIGRCRRYRRWRWRCAGRPLRPARFRA